MNLIEMFATQRNGKLLNEAQESFQALVKAVSETGVKGRLTVSFDVNPGADEGTVIITDDVIPKMPRPKKASNVWYADENGNIHREDPKHPELPGVVQMSEAASQ